MPGSYGCYMKRASLRDPPTKEVYPRLSQRYNTVPAFDFYGPARSIARPLNHLALDILRFARSTLIAEPQATQNVLIFDSWRRMGSGACIRVLIGKGDILVLALLVGSSVMLLRFQRSSCRFLSVLLRDLERKQEHAPTA